VICGGEDADSFEKFGCVGGIPKYWEFAEAGQDAVGLAESLYFDFAPYMEQEPHRLLRDEGVSGLNAVAVLEAVGRGAERPSEIAARLGTAQTNLSRLLTQLLDASILARDLPFGESVRSTKKVLYRIQDPATRFWFRVYSPHQSRWRSYSPAEKRKLIRDHAATVFEDVCRTRYPGARRYWESNVELDLVAPDPDDPRRLLVAEVKWRRLSAAERQQVLGQLEAKWARISHSHHDGASRALEKPWKCGLKRTAPANRDGNTVNRLSVKTLPLHSGPSAPFPPVKTRYRAVFQSPDMGTRPKCGCADGIRV
jgi:hypothetical protein